jgi:hypothetical protein
MIPTRLKARLPRYLSYPVGAEAISGALVGARHIEALSVTFNDQAVWPASEFRRLLVERLSYRVMAAEYRPTRKPGIGAADFMVRRGWYDERWELVVYPVLAEFRHLTNRLLLEEGMPAIATWLKSSGRSGWNASWHRIELWFDPVAGSIAARESDGV